MLVPELVVRHWWEGLLHNRRADLLKVILLMRGNRRIVVINIPWYLERDDLCAGLTFDAPFHSKFSQILQFSRRPRTS